MANLFSTLAGLFTPKRVALTGAAVTATGILLASEGNFAAETGGQNIDQKMTDLATMGHTQTELREIGNELRDTSESIRVALDTKQLGLETILGGGCITPASLLLRRKDKSIPQK